MSTPTNKPAFPLLDNAGSGLALSDPGMDLRDFFAAVAMQGLLAKNGACHPADAYEMADGMLKARAA